MDDVIEDICQRLEDIENALFDGYDCDDLEEE